MVSRNAINGGREGKKSQKGWQEEKEKVVGVDRHVREGESVFVTCVLCYYIHLGVYSKSPFFTAVAPGQATKTIQ